MSLNKRNGMVVVSFLFFISSWGSLLAQEKVIRVETNLVEVPLVVLDRQGRYATNLNKENFQIFQDDVEQEIAVFETTEKPLTILILLDLSCTMHGHLPGMNRAVDAFAKQLRPDDQLMVVGFGDYIIPLLDLTKMMDLPEEIKVGILPIQQSTTPYDKDLQMGIDPFPLQSLREKLVFDAVGTAQKKMRNIKGRKAIVLFSDGVGTGKWATAKSTLREAEEQDASIYSLQFEFVPSFSLQSHIGKKAQKKLGEKGMTYMTDLAAKTGGRRYEVKNVPDIEATFKAVADELRQQYNIGYYPSNEGKKGERRHIKVKVLKPDLAVCSRNSYVIGEKK